MRNHYETLGVPREASGDQIKKAWRQIAMRCHPDRAPDNPAATQRFRDAKEAYGVLIDPAQRVRYDTILAASSLFACACGRPKLPGSALCTWCGLAAYQARQRAEAAARARRKQEQRRAAQAAREAEDRIHFEGRRQAPRGMAPGYRPSPGDGDRPAPAASAPERSWERAGEYMEGAGDGVPTADVLLEGVASHVAFQAAGTGVDVRVEVGPDGRVRVSGGSVKEMEKVRDSLGTATRLLSGLWGFIDRRG